MKKNSQNLDQKIRELPHKPGVYLFKDRLNHIIYVGKARDLRKRVSQYFHPSKKMNADLKTRSLLQSIWDIETYAVASEPESILLEGKLIKEYRPKYNVSFRDDKRFFLAKINLHEPFPKFSLTRIKKDDGARYFGPFAHSSSLRKTLDLIHRKFHIRSCSPRLPGENDYKHCHDDIIKNCSAPCVQKISQEDYMRCVLDACEFLEGRSEEMLAELEKEMGKAAQQMHFEKAAQLRNIIDDIKLTTKPHKRFLKEIPTHIIPQQALLELQKVLNLPHLPQAMECFDISNISDTHKVASMVSFKEGRPYKKNYRRYRIKTVEGQDDFASMAEVVYRRYARLIKENKPLPDLIVVDGGKGQLSAALKQLHILKFPRQPIIGLAKQNEEIYQPHSSHPLILPRDSQALQLLQRIRDEAHRFANTYHQLLMKKRITESILDECPGVSSHKKKILLQHFGSISKIRKASPEQLATVKGISSNLAQTIFDFFASLKHG